MADNEKLTVEEAAALLGMSRKTLTKRLRMGILDIGYVFSPEQTGQKQWIYLIYRSKVERYMS